MSHHNHLKKMQEALIPRCEIYSKLTIKTPKRRLATGVSRKQSMPSFPKNEPFLPSDRHTYACVSGGRNVRFSKNLACFVFFKRPF